MILRDTASKFLACHRQALKRTPSQGEKHILYIKVQPKDQIAVYSWSITLGNERQEPSSHFWQHSLWGQGQSRYSCVHMAHIACQDKLLLQTNTKRKGWKIILDLVCGDNVSGNFRPAVLGTHDKRHWQISGHTRLQWLWQSLCSYFLSHLTRRKTSLLD